MNNALFGYILAWLGVIYCIIEVIAYRKLPYLIQRGASINFNLPLTIFLISVAYIATYHIS